MDREMLEIAREAAKGKDVTEEDVIRAVEALEQIKRIVVEAWEAIKELINDIVECLPKSHKQPSLPKFSVPPMDTTRVSQVLQRKPMFVNARANL